MVSLASSIRGLGGERLVPVVARALWLLVLLLGVMACFHVLQDFVPRPAEPPQRPPQDAASSARQLAALALFPESAPAERRGAGGDFELLGVLAGGEHGTAILRRKGETRSLVFSAGADLPGGGRLLRIERDTVVLAQGSAETRLVLKRTPRAQAGRPEAQGVAR